MKKEEFILQILRIFYPGHKTWLVKTLVIAGLGIISRPFWEPIVVGMLKEYTKIDIPNADWAGWVLLLIGLTVYGLNEWFEYSKTNNQNTPKIETPNLSLQWSSPESHDFDNDIEANYCSFHCFDTPSSDSPCQLIHSAGNIPNNLKEIQGHSHNIHKLTLTNHGNTPAFNISFPIRVECCKNDKDGNGYLVNEETSSFFGSIKTSVLPGEKAVYYLHNTSEHDHWLNVQLFNHIEAGVFDSEEKVKVNYTWEGFRPIALTLNKNA